MRVRKKVKMARRLSRENKKKVCGVIESGSMDPLKSRRGMTFLWRSVVVSYPSFILLA